MCTALLLPLMPCMSPADTQDTGGEVNTNTTEELLRLKDNAASRTNGSELVISKPKVERIKFLSVYTLKS